MKAENGKKGGSPLYMKIYNDYRERIEAGEYSPDTRLPSEKEIALEYGVSRITSQKAMTLLEENGYITRTPGKGSFIREKQPAASGGTSRLIGVVMENFTPSFGGEILLGIERECAKRGCSMILKCTYGSAQVETAAIEQLLSLGVSGLIIHCTADEIYNPLIVKLSLEGFPLILIDRELKGIPLPYVGIDNAAAAEALTEALFAKGHRKISLIAGEGSLVASTIEKRAQGFTKSCANHGEFTDESQWITSFKNDITGGRSREIAGYNEKIFLQFAEAHPEVSAYVATSYAVGQAAVLATRELLKRCGRTCEIACFDSPDDLILSHFQLYIRQDQWEIGRRASEYLIRRMAGEVVPHVTYIPYYLGK